MTATFLLSIIGALIFGAILGFVGCLAEEKRLQLEKQDRDGWLH